MLFAGCYSGLLAISVRCFRYASGDCAGVILMPALTKRLVDAAKPKEADYFLWCSSTPGFGIRIYPSGKRVFVCQVRVGRATRRIKIGIFGAYTVEQARQRAQEIIRAASEGRDPQREKSDGRKAITVSELCDDYVEAARARPCDDAVPPAKARRNSQDR